jgi:hypothetical protein
MKILSTVYHSQLDNKILPYVTCGTTCMANYFQWLNIQYEKNYMDNDDGVLEKLNDAIMLGKAQELIDKKIIGEVALSVRNDDPRTPDVDESEFNHLNNYAVMLAELGNYITNRHFQDWLTEDKSDFIFKSDYRSIEDMKTSIDEGFQF